LALDYFIEQFKRLPKPRNEVSEERQNKIAPASSLVNDDLIPFYFDLGGRRRSPQGF